MWENKYVPLNYSSTNKIFLEARFWEKGVKKMNTFAKTGFFWQNFRIDGIEEESLKEVKKEILDWSSENEFLRLELTGWHDWF